MLIKARIAVIFHRRTLQPWHTTFEIASERTTKPTSNWLPRATRTTQATKVDELYPVEVIARDEDKVKIHYIGYGDEDDEWRDTAEIVETQPDVEPYVPFDAHRELAYQIALAK